MHLLPELQDRDDHDQGDDDWAPISELEGRPAPGQHAGRGPAQQQRRSSREREDCRVVRPRRGPLPMGEKECGPGPTAQRIHDPHEMQRAVQIHPRHTHDRQHAAGEQPVQRQSSVSVVPADRELEAQSTRQCFGKDKGSPGR